MSTRVLIDRSLDHLSKCWHSLVRTDLIYKLLAFCLFSPVFSLVLGYALALSGNRVLTDLDIVHFIAGPLGLLISVLLGAIWLGLLAIEQASLLGVLAAESQGKTRTDPGFAVCYRAQPDDPPAHGPIDHQDGCDCSPFSADGRSSLLSGSWGSRYQFLLADVAYEVSDRGRIRNRISPRLDRSVVAISFVLVFGSAVDSFRTDVCQGGGSGSVLRKHLAIDSGYSGD